MPESKTPKFDKLLDDIFRELSPHERVCSDCGSQFPIEAEDIVFLKMFRSPVPKLCPSCRQRQRLAFANYSNIYRRKCDVPGHEHMILSPIPPVMPWIAYDHATYYSDTWDAKTYGRDIKNGEDFFAQLLDLLKVVPHRGVPRGANSPNSEFSFYGKEMKDCYYVFGGRRSEDIMYSTSVYDSRHVMDSYFPRQVDTVYENVVTNDCFKTKYAYFSSDCIECDFIYDCRNCQNCFGCVNLRNKSYCWFNAQLSKDEYLQKRDEANLGSATSFRHYQGRFREFLKSQPVRAARISKSDNCVGNDIKSSKNLYNVYLADDSENIRHASFAIMKIKDSMDINHSGGVSERIYNCQNAGTKSSDVKFSMAVKECVDCEYLMYSLNCQNCFGCIGLSNASYMIFNKQYSKKEYFEKIDEIKSEMMKNGSYGEFLPMSFSPTAYNSSLAEIIYPMTEKEARRRGLYWQPDTEADTKGLKIISAKELPDDIDDAKAGELCSLAVRGEVSGKPFKFTEREIDFYKRNKIPLPVDTPYQRIIDRFKILNNFKVFFEKCFSCGKPIQSAYRVSDGWKPYCEDCYQKEIL